MKRLFSTGRILISQMASRHLDMEVISNLLNRHKAGDWGDITQDDIRANDEALRTGARLMSVYVLDDRKWYVITEADRSSTTLLLAEEY